MRISTLVVFSGLLLNVILLSAEMPVPRLLITAQRLKRLKRERERETPRWVAFENRIENAPDSSERGFELALYYLVTGDESRAREAGKWAATHPCETRQVALIRAWCPSFLERAASPPSCSAQSAKPVEALRDRFFELASNDGSTEQDLEENNRKLIDFLRSEDSRDAQQFYAAIEYLIAVRNVEHIDARDDDRKFFSTLPLDLLLSLKPAEVERPEWLIHVAALALVSLDPNMDSSQFLQGWAIEDRQMLREGPGVAYEFLWGDPYLPGVGYQNLDTWLYDDTRGRLVGRTNWESSACWVKISSTGVEDENCKADWQQKPIQFGRLTLLPMSGTCLEVPRSPGNETTVIWKLKPKERLKYNQSEEQQTSAADSTGLWRVPVNASGKVCLAAANGVSPDKLRVSR